MTDNNDLDIGKMALLEKVDKFCYLAVMLNAECGCCSALVAKG